MIDIDFLDAEKLKAIHERLSRFSKADLVVIARAFRNWEWPTLLGEPPIENWKAAPNYRRSWMGEDVRCRSDYIDPYMALLRTMGITSDDERRGAV